MISLFAFRAKGDRSRERILAHVKAKPGITTNDLAKRLGMYGNAVRYHVRVLAKAGQIEVRDRGWSHELYATGVPARYWPWLRAFADEECNQVIRALDKREAGVYELSDELGFSRKLVRRHLGRLIEDGIVDKIGEARPRYRARKVPSGLLALLQHPEEGIHLDPNGPVEDPGLPKRPFG